MKEQEGKPLTCFSTRPDNCLHQKRKPVSSGWQDGPYRLDHHEQII